MTGTPLAVLVAVGTDVHPFGRLIRWADDWARRHPEDQVVVQHGHSPPPRHAGGVGWWGRSEMIERLGVADVVVLSCGPGAVMDARGVGRVPLVVPRRRDLGEHVDDHQRAFARHLAAHGIARTAEDTARLDAECTRARLDPDRFRCRPGTPDGSGVAGAARLLDGLLARP